MSARPPWVTGSDIPFPRTLRDELPMIPGAAYGGTVYSQSGLAACRALQDDSREADDATKSVAASLHVSVILQFEASYLSLPHSCRALCQGQDRLLLFPTISGQ